jgi:hypothetical protein
MKTDSGGPIPLPISQLDRAIRIIRDQPILLDFDLAPFFGVSVRNFLRSFRRNLGRFPTDFAFQLDIAESREVASHRRRPFVFTAEGVLTLSFVLRTALAVQSSVFLIRAMVIVSNSPPSRRVIRRKLLELERQVGDRTHPVRQLLAAVNRMLVSPRRADRLLPFPGPCANEPR